MSEFAARIGRIRMKNGGAEVRVLNTGTKRNEVCEALMESARSICSVDEGALIGHVLVGIFDDGRTAVGFNFDDNNSPIPRALIPSWLADVARRELITRSQASATFREMFEWVE